MKKTALFLAWTLVQFLPVLTYSQSPGGVDGAQVWFKTKKLPTNYFAWQDFAGDGVKINNWNTTTEYQSSGRYFNFNAGLYLDGYSRQFFLKQTNLSQGTIIGVFGHYSSYINYQNLLYGITARANEGVIVSNDKVINSTERNGEVLDYGEKEGEDLFRKADNTEGTDAKYRERALKVVSYFQYQQPSVSVWGEDNTADFTLGYGYLNTAKGLSSYSIPSFSNNFFGFIPEVLVYSRVLNPLERRKAETYLALKYGISLSDSYINSEDKLIWDLSENKGYNNRITGIIRSDRSALYQPISTTSYEEANYQSDQYDSYQFQDPTFKSSQYRLLVMGQAPANKLEDKSATLWGDNNGTLTTQVADGIAGLKVMGRKWKLNTTIAPATTVQKTLTFNGSGLTTVSEVGKTTFTNTTAASTGTTVTAVPLQTENGYLEIMPQNFGGITILKFGTQTGLASSSDYGIKIDAFGTLYLIERTLAPVYIGSLVANYRKITIEKKANKIYFNVFDTNGNRTIPTRILTVLPADSAKPFYGVVSLEKKTTDRSLTFRHGGFVDTGSQIELSYDGQRAAEFAANTTKSYLIVDRTGTGTFPTGSVDYYLTDELDPSRSKILFNNIFWDTDGNGKDVFSFGYRDATVKLIAVEQALAPTCKDNILQQDGKINIEIKEGLPGYKYTLTKTGSTAVLETGTFFETNKTLSNLAAGDYDLTLEMIGSNFEKKPAVTTLDAVATTTALPINTNGAIEWTVTDFNADKYVGFISQKTTLTTGMLNYGVQIKQDKLYFWNKGVVGTTPLATLTKGSKIKVERRGNTIVCSVGGVSVGVQTIATPDLGLSYFGLVALNSTVNGIYNVVTTGFVTGTAKLLWTSNPNILLVEGDATTSKVVQKVTLDATVCKPPVVPPTPVVTNNVVIAPVPSRVNTDFSINITLNNPSEAMVLIFNTGGTMLKQIRIPSSQKNHTITTQIGTAGFYIIKVLTLEGEFSKSIIITP